MPPEKDSFHPLTIPLLVFLYFIALSEPPVTQSVHATVYLVNLTKNPTKTRLNQLKWHRPAPLGRPCPLCLSQAPR